MFQPFEDVIPYEELSVRIAKRDVPDLIPILRYVCRARQGRAGGRAFARGPLELHLEAYFLMVFGPDPYW